MSRDKNIIRVDKFGRVFRGDLTFELHLCYFVIGSKNTPRRQIY